MPPPRHIAVVIPARDECRTIGVVVSSLRTMAFTEGAVLSRIIVCDNGSRDDTAARARAAGAYVVVQPERGYGAACQTALAAVPSRCDTILFVDADGSADVLETPRLVRAIAEGSDLAIGWRRTIHPHALTPVQRAGTRLVCVLMSILWHRRVHDLGPFRAIRHDALLDLGMTDRGFGWTAEMQARAYELGLVTVEVPVSALPRMAGHSKISGTASGVLRAGRGLVGAVLRQWFAGRWRRLRPSPARLHRRA